MSDIAIMLRLEELVKAWRETNRILKIIAEELQKGNKANGKL